MASDTDDFRFIVETVFGQKPESPLLKAFEKTGINNYGDLWCFRDDNDTDSFKYFDYSQGTFNAELGQEYSQLIRYCFHVFVDM